MDQFVYEHEPIAGGEVVTKRDRLGNIWRWLSATVTYPKAEVGDEFLKAMEPKRSASNNN